MDLDIMQPMPIHAPSLSEAGSRFWTVIFAGITAVGLVFGGVYTLIQYLGSYSIQVATAQFNAKQPYYSQHLQLCTQASTDAATIATTKDTQKKQAATEDFWRLYWGPLGMVEETEVGTAMVAFGNCLQGTCPKDIEQLSLDLAHGCRTEVSRHFSLNLPAPPDKHLERNDNKGNQQGKGDQHD